MTKQSLNIVWLKRDLRTQDHAPLAAAVETGIPTAICYFFEPSLLAAPQYTPRHWRFVWQSLQDMQERLRQHRQKLYIFHCEVLEALTELNEQYEIQHLFAHLEVGIKLTYDRDRAVKAFCRKNGIRYAELPQDGVIRGLKNRIGWEAQVNAHLTKSIVNPNLSALQTPQLPANLFAKLNRSSLPTSYKSEHPKFQPGGETKAWQYFNTFIQFRSEKYIHHLSKPEASRKSSSRISPFLAYGNVSMRQLFKKVEQAKRTRRDTRMLEHFQSRLWWRSHYMQKLESDWCIEFDPINKGFLQLDRRLDERFEAWKTAQTGIPMVDASMLCLQENGYINFRMRAMLITFATFACWQDWKAVADYLAQLFLDFEPGIHYAQIQMQAGLTGYHTMRVFNPIVQGQQHDSEGVFIRKWLPALKLVPTPLLFEPWKMTALEEKLYHCQLGKDYPKPIVDYAQSTKTNKEKYWTIRKQAAVQDNLEAIWKKFCVPKDIHKYKNVFGLETNKSDTQHHNRIQT